MKNLFNEEYNKAVEDIKSAVEWGRATDEVDYYLGTSLDKWANKLSKTFDLDFDHVYDLLYKEVIKN